MRGCREVVWLKMVWKHSGHSQTIEGQWQYAVLYYLLPQNSTIFLFLKSKDLCEVDSSHQLLLLLNNKERWGESQDRFTGWCEAGWTSCPALPESSLVQPVSEELHRKSTGVPYPCAGSQMDWVGCQSPVTPLRKQISSRRRDASLPVGQMVLFHGRKTVDTQKNVSHQWPWGLEGNLTLGKKERGISSTVWACDSPC